MEPRYKIPQWVRFLEAHKDDGDALIVRANVGTMHLEAKRLVMSAKGLALFAQFTEPQSITEAAHAAKIDLGLARELSQLLVRGGLLVQDAPVGSRFERYSRHSEYFEMLGIDPNTAQERLAKAVVSLVGVGGIGTNLASDLIGTGLGEIRLIDPDRIELGNLTRQCLFSEQDVGLAKAEVAADVLHRRNSVTTCVPLAVRLDEDNALDLIDGSSIVVVSADRPLWIMRIVADACRSRSVPYFGAAYLNARGLVGPIKFGRSQVSCSCLEAIEPVRLDLAEPQLAYWRALQRNYQAPSYGPLNALVAAIAALELVKYLLGQPSRIETGHFEIDSETTTVQLLPGCHSPYCPERQTTAG